MRKPTWKIEVRPTKTGFRVRSLADVADTQARLMTEYIERCLLKVVRNLEAER